MSLDPINQFIEAMTADGCEPSKSQKLIPDDEIHPYSINGDKSGKMSGSYLLNVLDDGFTYGFYRNHREGITHNYHSLSTSKKLSKEEREEMDEKIKVYKRKQTLQRNREALKVSKEANKILNESDDAIDDHPYLLRKKVKTWDGIKENKGNLLIPMMSIENTVWSYQRITPDGDKWFLSGSKKQGCFFPLVLDFEPKNVIIICEGLSTGLSLREVLDLPVYVAFDAGNLLPVAKAVRGKHPDSKILIASDCDYWTFKAGCCPDGIDKSEILGNDLRWDTWRDSDLLRNIGNEKAAEAVVAIGGDLIIPPITPNDKTKRTDFNDVKNTDGGECILNVFAPFIDSKVAGGKSPADIGDVRPTSDHQNLGEVAHYETPSQIPPPDIKSKHTIGGALTFSQKISWKGDPLKGEPVKNSLNNVMVYMREHNTYAGIFCYNEFTGNIYVVKCPPWELENADEFKVRKITENDRACCEAFMEFRTGLTPGPVNLNKAINHAANHYSFHPVQEYFASLQWDGVPRLKTWLQYYARAENQDPKYLEAIGTKWLVAGVRRIMKPGCKFDHMLILEGKQNAGKSTLLQILATFGKGAGNEESFFLDDLNFNTIETRSTILKLQGKLIIEFQEIAGFGNKDINEIKKWITVQSDEVEVKFVQDTKTYPRQFILAGTFNPSQGIGWMKDATGNRRFWPVDVCGQVRFNALKRDKEQLWAEAVHLERDGYSIFLENDNEIYKIAEGEQMKRVDVEVWNEPIEDFISDKKDWRTVEILEKLGFYKSSDINRSHRLRVSNAMTQLGWRTAKVKRNGQWVAGWIKTELEEEIAI